MSVPSSLVLRAVRVSQSSKLPSSIRSGGSFLLHTTSTAMASGGASATLETLSFVNGALKLPVDSVKENYVRTVQGTRS